LPDAELGQFKQRYPEPRRRWLVIRENNKFFQPIRMSKIKSPANRWAFYFTVFC